MTTAEITAIAPPPPPPSEGLVLSYDMETLSPAGWMEDLSGQGHEGAITGTTDIAGRVGQAKHFDGVGDRITASTVSVPATDFTVAAWFRWTTNPSPYYSGIHGGGISWELRLLADGRFGIVFYQAIGPDVTSVLVAKDTTNPITSVRPSTVTEIGHVASDFTGDIDEVRVYARALTTAEITAVATG